MGGGLGDLVKNVVTFGAYGQKEAQSEAKKAQKKAEMEARRIAAEQKPMDEKATLQLQNDTASALDSLGLMIEPDKKKKKNIGTGTGTSSLGTSTVSSLGFGA